jgi:ribosomal protein S18 acetylase RimI-like enzyme
MIIRKLKHSDKEIFFKMMKDFFNTDAVLSRVSEKDIEKTFIEAISNSPYLSIYIFEKDGEVAGYSSVGTSFSSGDGGIVITFHEIYIKDDFRSQGIGGKFIDYIIKEHKEAVAFLLEVVEGNVAAQRLYKRKGFKFTLYKQMMLKPDCGED